jgi:hypothetical protein
MSSMDTLSALDASDSQPRTIHVRIVETFLMQTSVRTACDQHVLTTLGFHAGSLRRLSLADCHHAAYRQQTSWIR